MKRQQGFTMTEIIVALAVTVMLFGFTTVRLLNVQEKPQLSTVVDTLISDLKSQQLRAMTGDSGGGSSNLSYGIIFSQSGYTLFRGSIFSPSDSYDFTVNVLSPITITTTLPGGSIVFDKGGGEVVNYSSNGNTITVTNSANSEKKTITVNSLGNITGVQ